MKSPITELDPERETALLAEARSGPVGCLHATSELYKVFRRPVTALCLHVTGTRADAEDATQEAFVSVHRALPLFRGESRVRTWIFRIAIRASVELRGKRRNAQPLDLELPSSRGVESELVSRDEVRHVAAAMGRLAADQRAVLGLFALEGLSHKEIAEILGVTEGTVWSRLSAARRALTAQMVANPSQSGRPLRVVSWWASSAPAPGMRSATSRRPCQSRAGWLTKKESSA